MRYCAVSNENPEIRRIIHDALYTHEQLCIELEETSEFIYNLEECCGLRGFGKPKKFRGVIVHEALDRYEKGEIVERFKPLTRDSIREVRKKRRRQK